MKRGGVDLQECVRARECVSYSSDGDRLQASVEDAVDVDDDRRHVR